MEKQISDRELDTVNLDKAYMNELYSKLELLKNIKDGLKVCIEEEIKLADFWGSNGDKRK